MGKMNFLRVEISRELKPDEIESNLVESFAEISLKKDFEPPLILHIYKCNVDKENVVFKIRPIYSTYEKSNEIIYCKELKKIKDEIMNYFRVAD